MLQKETAAEYRRRRAVELIKEGESVSLIARILGVSLQAIYHWDKKLRSGSSLKTAPRSGRPRKLQKDQLKTLGELLLQGATAHGWPNDLWTAKRVGIVIRKQFSIKCSIGTVRRILKYGLGWTVQRPIQQEKERNESEIQQWIEHTFPQIVRDAHATAAHIVFVDEAGFMSAPTRRQTYAPRGKTPIIKVTDAHGRISVAGAITVSPVRRNLGFIYDLLPDNVNYHGDTIVKFMKEICRHIKGAIIILWDGFSIHRCPPVYKFLEQHPRVRIEPFPAYAHELNPVDKTWLYIKYDRLPNYAPTTLSELRRRLVQELKALRKKPKTLAWCIEQAGLKTKPLC